MRILFPAVRRSARCCAESSFMASSNICRIWDRTWSISTLAPSIFTRISGLAVSFTNPRSVAKRFTVVRIVSNAPFGDSPKTPCQSFPFSSASSGLFAIGYAFKAVELAWSKCGNANTNDFSKYAAAWYSTTTCCASSWRYLDSGSFLFPLFFLYSVEASSAAWSVFPYWAWRTWKFLIKNSCSWGVSVFSLFDISGIF